MNIDLFIEFVSSTYFLMWKFGLFGLFCFFKIIFITFDDRYFSLLETIVFVGLSYDTLYWLS